jgi:hypothetical protein
MVKIRQITGLLFILSLTACSSYKSTWDCPRVKGIGCSSVEYADTIAKEQIMLNKTADENTYQENTIILDKHLSKGVK